MKAISYVFVGLNQARAKRVSLESKTDDFRRGIEFPNSLKIRPDKEIARIIKKIASR